MKTFQQFIVEQNIQYKEALDIFGLSDFQLQPEIIKKRFKELALKHHPDRGGSTKQMQDIAASYELLLRTTTETLDKKDRLEVNIFKATAAMSSIENSFNFEKFLQHFSNIFGEPFEGEVFKDNVAKVSEYQNGINFKTNFFNFDRTIVFSIQIYVSIFGVGQGLASSENDGLSMTILTEILHNRRKIKLAQKNWLIDKNKEILSNPEILFPRKKIELQVEKSKTRELSKRDVFLILKNELKSKFNSDNSFAIIPISDAFWLQLYRVTYKRGSSWGINGIYNKAGKKLSHVPGVFSVGENDHFLKFIDGLKIIQKKNILDEDVIVHEITTLAKKIYDAVLASLN